MDKNTIIGIVLMIAVFVGFSFYQSYEMDKQQQFLEEQARVEQAERARQVAQAEAQRVAEEAMTPEERHMRDSIAAAERANAELYRHGSTLYARREGISQLDTVRNDLMSIVFDSRGGKVIDVTLNNYTRYAEGERTELVQLITPNSARMGLELHRNGGSEALNTNDYLFDTNIETMDDHSVITMHLDVDVDAWVEYVYTVYNTGDASRDYVVDFTIKQHNIDAMLKRGDEIVMVWNNRSNRNERSFQNESMASNILYYAEEDTDELDADGELEDIEGLNWIAFKQQYFSSVLMTKDALDAS